MFSCRRRFLDIECWRGFRGLERGGKVFWKRGYLSWILKGGKDLDKGSLGGGYFDGRIRVIKSLG